MKQIPIDIEIPSDVVIALNENPSDIHKKIKFWAAVGLYTLNKLSLAKAAKLCEMNVYEFEKILSENHISISNLRIEDLEKEFEQLTKI
jgi:predicted HTH domain antitoxin